MKIVLTDVSRSDRLVNRIRSAAALAALLLPIGVTAQDADVVGCYDVILADWSPPFATEGSADYRTPPRRIELTDTTATGLGGRPLPGRRAAAPARGVMPSIHSTAFWSSRAADSVEIILTTGFAGVRFELRQMEGDLAGTARSFTDVIGGPRHVAPATLQRVACDEQVPEEWRYGYRHGRGFRLPTGDSLLLGEPLPTGVTGDSIGPRSLRLDIRPAGALEGATSIGVSFDPEGHVRSIAADYPPDTPIEELVTRMESVWGPPSSMWSDTTASGEVNSGAAWDDPLIRKQVGRWGRPGGEMRVSMYMISRDVIHRPCEIR